MIQPRQNMGIPLFLAIIFSLCPLNAWSQDSLGIEAGEALFDQARPLYAEQRFEEAIPLIIQAIQADPDQASYYLGLSRALHFSERYELAVYYYDLFLTAFPEYLASQTGQNSSESIEQEKIRANSRRETPEEEPTLPVNQASAYTSLLERLLTGPYFNENGSGAYQQYRAVLRTGYAHPELTTLRADLLNGMLTEMEPFFQSTSEAPIPILPLSAWSGMRSLFEALEALDPLLATSPGHLARRAFSRAQAALLNESPVRAIEAYEEALASDGEMVVAYWGINLAQHNLVNATGTRSGPEPTDPRLLALEEIIRRDHPEHEPLLSLIQALVAYDSQELNLSAEILISLFENRSPELPPETNSASASE